MGEEWEVMTTIEWNVANKTGVYKKNANTLIRLDYCWKVVIDLTEMTTNESSINKRTFQTKRIPIDLKILVKLRSKQNSLQSFVARLS